MRVKAKTWGVIGKHSLARSGSNRFLWENKFANPNCRPYSSPHQVPKHKMLWYIEKGTLREVGKIDA
jgi:hypothetical protein